ncbi:FAD-dependent oxidoreductase [Aspergillus vadensis CBS 113365]|uniref:Extracellular salicylate hydroxylase/monooxygenase n=1 Tax=Aspergillus vadensis (strain CBS 113365 / IMI 142717 / IBT 24658) TaxID=1448311 RepID=A0A319B854_ASPVC|nr:extracellular salicylate hydroxylase/monooxygenase [Aspergillus vadensis CBS 113365]PYH68539.1 extracellular salicylate hydroxylase/monooxygenase [Aspergillus vadensis CBS 113365]
MKIIIIGAGISGCTAYLTLRKHLPPPPPSSPTQDHEYTIYEAYPSPNSPNQPTNPTNKITIGGGLGISPNGLRVLERLDETILHDAVSSGYMLDHTNLKDKHGKTLIQLPSSSSSSSSDCSGSSSGGSNGNKALHLLGTSRHNFWLALHSRIPENIIVYNKRVARVISHPTQRNTVTFVDGSEPVDADLVIGADGLRSVVRQSLLDGEGEGLGGPRYEGLIGIGGFLPTSTIPQTITTTTTIGGIEPGSLNLHFSGTGFFGYFYATSSPTSPTRSSAYHVSEPGDTLVWWTTYSTPTSTSTPPDGRDVDVDDVKAQLKERFSTWTDPLVRHIINSVEVQTMWPTFTTPELPTWEREGVVLVGDAAHALPSTSGQGASQALEDVEALARLVGHEVGVWYMEQMRGSGGGGVEGEKRAIQMACKRYVEMRMPRVKRILDTARGMQNSKRDMGGWGEWVMYWVMWVMGFFPGLVARQQQEVFGYDLPAEVERVLDQGL